MLAVGLLKSDERDIKTDSRTLSVTERLYCFIIKVHAYTLTKTKQKYAGLMHETTKNHFIETSLLTWSVSLSVSEFNQRLFSAPRIKKT